VEFVLLKHLISSTDFVEFVLLKHLISSTDFCGDRVVATPDFIHGFLWSSKIRG
jgi:hypothetical protein